MQYVRCRSCGLPVKIEYQIRPKLEKDGVVMREEKTPLLVITCRNPDCGKLHKVTFSVEKIEDYETRDLSVWGC